MTAFAQICMFSSFLILIVGVMLYDRNPTQWINRMFVLLSGVLFYWGFSQFEFLQASDAEAALFWMRLGAFWYMVPAVVLNFVIVFADVKARRLILYFLLYVPAFLLSLWEALLIPYQVVRMPWGWDYYYSGYFGYVEILWVMLPTLAALLLLARRYWNSRSDEERIGVRYLLAGLFIPTVAGTISAFVPFFTSINVPDLAVPTSALGFLLVGYAVFRHGMYVMTPGAAADDILTAMADPLFLVNATGEIIISNKAASQVFEYETSELAGKRLGALVPDSNFMKAVLGTDSPNIFETDFKTRQGRTIPVSLSKSAITTKQGNLIGYVMICRDMTERKRLETQLSEAQRLAAIGEAAAMVGHDLRNPLQATANTLYLTRKLLTTTKVKDKEEAVELLKKLDNQVYYMDKIVSDLQDYARPVGAELIETNLPDLIREAILAARIPGGVECSMMIERDLSNAMTNPVLLKRVLINLINNAVQAMPEGGRITITALKHQNSLTVAVQDTGVGIPPASLEKIFNPFFTTKAQGQGLGLAVCKRLVEAQGGTITVKSKMGEGSTFTITIPNKSTGAA